MILTNELKVKMFSKGYSQANVAKKLNITPKTMYMKMKKGVFNSNEIAIMIEMLDIEDPLEIFFAKKVS